MAYTIVKTPIVSYGGKTSMLNHLLEMVPIHESYNEPFFNGGTLFFAKTQVKNETINDRLDIVINFYRTLRTHFKPLKKLVDATLISRSIHNEALNLIRQHGMTKHAFGGSNFNKMPIALKVKLAWAFWVCTNFAYANKIGGGYKYSNDQSVSVPDTLAKRKEMFTDLLVARIEHAYIENEDAIKICNSRNKKKTFHYLDPPYPETDQGHYSGYGWDQYGNLLDWCEVCEGKFLLSSYNNELLDKYTIKNGWHKKEIVSAIPKNKSSRSRKNEIKTEVLISNYSTPCGTLNLFL